MANFLLNISILFALLATVNCNLDAGSSSNEKKKLKVLVNNPGLSFSHMQFQGKLADVLVEAGHEVHVLLFEQNPLVGDYNGTFKAHRIIRGSMSQQKKDEFLKIPAFSKPFEGTTNWFSNGLMENFRVMMANLCEDIVRLHQPLLRELAKENYDVGISESYDPCFFGILHAVGVKTKIGTFAIATTNWAGGPFGVPNIPSFVINYFAPSISGPNMNFWERTLNFYSFAQEYFQERDKIYSIEQQYFNDAYGPEFPSLWSIAKSVSLCFVNGNEFFELPRPLSNKIIHIGGIATGVFEKAPAKKVTLSPEIQPIFENTKDGVVLFSFGTLTNTKVMSQEMKMAFLKAFTQFPTYDFIWKIDQNENDSELFSNAPNVHIFEWFNQKAILAQPKLKAFITHCGLNSMNEAASEGVPMIGIPLFGDQAFNAAIISHKKSGVYVDILDMYTENKGSKVLTDALNKVLHLPEYSHNAKVVQKKLMSMPFKPKEKFVKWIEFAAQFSDLDELNLPTKDEMSLFVYYSLDVISFSVVVFSVLIFLLLIIIRKVSLVSRGLYGLCRPNMREKVE